MNDSLFVAESFYSIQGEGKTAGAPSFFIRLAGCNLMCGGKGTEHDGKLHNCATWRCDSIEVWRKGAAYTHQELFDKLGGEVFLEKIINGAHLIITGGEPLLQQSKICSFLNFLLDNYDIMPFVEIETNGTILPSEFLKSIVRQWNCSPKLKNSGVYFLDRCKNEVIDHLARLKEKAIFKFVVSSKEDWEEIKQTYVSNSCIKRSQIWLMPAVDNIKDFPAVSQVVAEICKENALNFSSRTHICIWDKKTGV